VIAKRVAERSEATELVKERRRDLWLKTADLLPDEIQSD
jgi:hypothetical protein